MLFSDIEGSTALLNGLGDRYGEALSAQRALLRAAFSSSGGREMGTEGDSFFVVFESAQDAVRSCVAAQRALSAHDWPGGVAVRVRMGLHSGEPTRHEDGYIGLDVHRAARIAATAHGGQVVLSEATRLLAGSRLPPGVSVRDLGFHRLKDIEAPERIYQLVAPGLAEQFPPLKSLGPPAATVGVTPGVHGFPAALTSFVGRSVELDEVGELLARYRLVTVTGPGGMGKTRLAGEVARRVAGRFADGVWLTALAGVAEPDLVPAAVAAALGIRQGGRPAMEALAEVLAARQVLLVLDNCEHLIDAVAGLCAALLPAADDVRILATSREPAGVAGEARYRLPPLGLPEPGQDGGAGGSAAVALFADRARQADPHFTMTGETGSAVARLVSRLDGMPLAIELAAARVETLGLGPLLDRLDGQLSLLAGTDRLAPARHRSLAATVDWSYQLLGEEERRVFRRLSAFPGPFTLAAAEAVAGAGAGPVVLHLADCSLLVPPRAGPDGQPRYRMLETLRAFGALRLAEAGEGPDAAAALAQHALQVAGQAAAGLATRDGERAAARWLDAEDATVHQALGWALEHDPDAALRLATALAPWWLLRGRWATGYQLLAAAAAGPAGGDRPDWCTAQFWLGVLTAASSVTTSFRHLTLARDALAGRPPAPLLAWALAWRAGALANLGRVRQAAGEGRRALDLARELGDPAAEAYALYWLATAAGYVGSLPEAEDWLRQAQRIDQAAIPGWIGRHCTIILARVLAGTGEAAEARRYGAGALALARQAGALYDEGDSLLTMALLDVYAGQLAEARAHVREVMELYAQTGASLLLINCLELCMSLCAATRSWRDAITVWAALAAVRRATWTHGEDDPAGGQGFPEPLRQAGEALGPALARAAEERGAAMTPAAAAEYVLLLVAGEPGEPAAAPGLPHLSKGERELVTLVAQGRTNAQIAAELSISVRTVRSRLDRIRAKTGGQRRADLTRLALQANLV